MPAQALKEFLDGHLVKYATIVHSPAYTAQEIAASTHFSGRELAKTVMVKLDGKMVMAVLPGTKQVDLALLRDAVGALKAELALEEEFRGAFPDCDIGAMPPFGNLYGLEVYAARELATEKHIVFNAGSHSEIVRLKYRDFERLAKPKVLDFCRKAPIEAHPRTAA